MKIKNKISKKRTLKTTDNGNEFGGNGFRFSLRTIVRLFLLGIFFSFLCVYVIFFLNNRSGSLFYLVKYTYSYLTSVLPVICIFFSLLCISCFYQLKNKTFLYASAAGVMIALFSYGMGIYASVIEPHNLKIRTLDIYSDKITSPMKIVHITDIQADKVREYDKKIFGKIKSLNPDMVLFTGDLVQPTRSEKTETKIEFEKIINLFETLPAECKVYGVFGDVDGYAFYYPDKEFGRLKMLRSEQANFESGGNNIHILGLSLGDSRAGDNFLINNWHKNKEDGQFTILMGHAPDYILSMNELPVDLCLAGHTHGGQVRIPFYGAVFTLSRIPREIARGFNKIGNTFLNISAGTGCEHAAGLPDIRFNCPPEITLINLLPKK